MDHNASPQSSVATQAEKLVYFPRSDGSRIPYKVYSSPEIYRVEQERIFHGPVWSFSPWKPRFRIPATSRAPSSATRRSSSPGTGTQAYLRG